MSTDSKTCMEKANRNLPPKRGQIKVQIFKSIKERLVSRASKAGKRLGIIRRSSKGGDCGGGSASTTPPPSGYNSDVNSSIIS